MFNFSGRNKSSITLQQFIEAVKNGSRDFFSLLQTPSTDFEQASFQGLMANTSDVLSGVNRVLKNFSDLYFQFFNCCLVKYHDSGDIKFVFYTITRDAEKIIGLADILFREFGHGYYDADRFVSFSRHDKVRSLAAGIYTLEKDDLGQIWITGDVNFILQYKTNPLFEFSLMVTQSKKKEIDRSVRRNGTVLDCLSFDIHNPFGKATLISQKRDEKSGLTDFTFLMEKKQLGVFDLITARIFGVDPSPDIKSSTNLFLSASVMPGEDEIIAVTEKLIKIYGQDNLGSADLEMYERELLEAGKFWTGRTWNMNDVHGLFDSKKANEKMSYYISADCNGDEGFRVTILGFNTLVELFGA